MGIKLKFLLKGSELYSCLITHKMREVKKIEILWLDLGLVGCNFFVHLNPSLKI